MSSEVASRSAHPSIVQEEAFVKGPFVVQGKNKGAVRNSIVAQEVALTGKADFESRLSEEVLANEKKYQALKDKYYKSNVVTTIDKKASRGERAKKKYEYDQKMSQFEANLATNNPDVLRNHRFYNAAEVKFFKGFNVDEEHILGFSDYDAPVKLASEKIKIEQAIGMVWAEKELEKMVKARLVEEEQNHRRTSPRRGSLSHLMYLAGEWYLGGVKKIITGQVEALAKAVDESFIRDTLEQNSVRDPLTGALNRAGFGRDVSTALTILNAGGSKFALVFLDIDSFKKLNDSEPRGHDAGDDVLRELFRVSGTSLGDLGVAGRWGGEEAVALLRVPDMDQAIKMSLKLGRDIRSQVAKNVRNSGKSLDRESVTVSMGMLMAEVGMTFEQLITQSDHMMYLSKTTGKDRLTVELDGKPVSTSFEES